jgi:hypothetical protein
MTAAYLIELTPAAYARECDRLRHMAHRAARCRDLTPPGMKSDRYPDRLERAAVRLSGLEA